MTCVMAIIERWKPEPWNPTKAQEETALRLSHPFVGARGRTFSDGRAELRTLEDEEVRHYVIFQDGTTRLLESTTPSVVYKRTRVARRIIGATALAAGAWFLIAKAAGVPSQVLGLPVGVLFVCFLGFFVTEGLMNREIEASGEQWLRIGGGDF
jgi:hypothetical protein